MKKYLLISGLTALGFLSACDKENEEPAAADSNEVSLLVATSIASDTYGLNALIQQSAGFQKDAMSDGGRSSICDYTDEGEYDAVSEQNSVIAYSYNFSYDVAVNCSSLDFPTSLSVDFEYAGQFDGPNLLWNHEGIGDFDVTMDQQENLIYTGSYDRNGNYAFKKRENIAGSTTVEIFLSNVKVDTETHQIISGSANYEIDVARPNHSYSLSGTITFNGNNVATLSINGNNVSFDLTSGSINQ